MSTTTEENERIARRVPEDVATERNVDLIEDLLADDFVEHGAFRQETHDREGMKEQVRGLLEAFPDFEAPSKTP